MKLVPALAQQEQMATQSSAVFSEESQVLVVPRIWFRMPLRLNMYSIIDATGTEASAMGRANIV